MKLVLTNCNLYDGTLNMKVQNNVSIEITDGIITNIGYFDVDDDTKCINLNGKFVVPGLINLHAHLPSSGKLAKKKLGDKSKLAKFVATNPIGRAIGNLLVKKYALTALNSGVTTVRTVGGVGTLDSDLRDKINAGKIIGPRLLVSNTAIGVSGGHMDKTVAEAVKTKDEIIQRIKSLKEQKVDLVKLMITGGVLDGKEPGHPAPLKMSEELVKISCEEAHKHGMKVAAHVESPEGMDVAIRCGVDSLEHGASFDVKYIPLMKEKGQCVVTTFEAAIPFIRVDPEIVGYGEIAKINSQIVLDGMIESAKMCLDNDIPVGLGTDAGSTLSSHYNFYKELILFSEFCDVSKEFALYSATLGNAKIAGIDTETGSVEIGKYADLLIIENDPMNDLQNLGKPIMVVMKGLLINKPKIKRDKVLDKLIEPII